MWNIRIHNLFISGCFVNERFFLTIHQPLSIRSHEQGSTEYSPRLSVKSLEELSTTWDSKSKFHIVLLYAPTVSKLKKLAKSLRPFIDSNTLILINSSFSIFLEPIINSILPQNNVLAMFSTVDVKLLRDATYLLCNPNVNVQIGISIDMNTRTRKMMHCVPSSTFQLLSAPREESHLLHTFISLLNRANVHSVNKVPAQKKSGFSTHIWKHIISLICFDCFAIVYKEFDIAKLFSNPLFASPIRHVMDELLYLAQWVGNDTLPKKETDKRQMIQWMIFTQEEKVRTTISSTPLELRSYVTTSILLFNYLMGQETNIGLLIFHLILVAAEFKIKVPNLEFLYSVLCTQPKSVLSLTAHSNHTRYGLINGHGLEVAHVDPTAVHSHPNINGSNVGTVQRDENANSIKTVVVEQEGEDDDDDDDGDDSEKYSSAASSIDSALKDLYVDGDAAALSMASGAMLSPQNGESKQKEQDSEEIEPKRETPEVQAQSQTAEIQSPFLNLFPSTHSLDQQLLKIRQLPLLASPSSGDQLQKEISLGPTYKSKDPNNELVDEELDLIESPFYQEEYHAGIPSRTDPSYRLHPSARVGGFKKMASTLNSGVSADSSNDYLGQSRRGYRPPKVIRQFSRHSESTDTQSLLRDRLKLVETIKSGGIMDQGSRYGHVDSSFSATDTKFKEK